LLQPGTFLVVFPGDAHRIKMQVSGPEQVRKAVFKFKL
jgi:beta-galactosidase beta subunit